MVAWGVRRSIILLFQSSPLGGRRRKHKQRKHSVSDMAKGTKHGAGGGGGGGKAIEDHISITMITEEDQGESSSSSSASRWHVVSETQNDAFRCLTTPGVLQIHIILSNTF